MSETRAPPVHHPRDWALVRAIDAAEPKPGSTTIGPFGSNLVANDYRPSGVPVVFVRDIRESGFEWNSNVYIDPGKAGRLSAHAVEPGDIVATKMGLPPCIAAVYPSWMNPGVVTADVIRLRPDRHRIDGRWLVRALNGHDAQAQVRAITGGVTRPKVTLRDFRELWLTLPSLPEQRRIAEVLDTLDEAIRKTEQLIAKLKQVKQGLLHDLLTRGIDENGELRDPERHPEQFKKSPLGRIPKGWGVRNLSDVGAWVSGGTPSKSNPSYWGGTLPWVSPKDMKKFLLDRTQDAVTEEGAAAGSRVVPANSVFIVVRGMILAHTFPVCIAMNQMSLNQDVKAIIPHEEIEGKYLAYWFVANSELLLRIVTEATHGTKRIDLGDLHRQCMAIPPLGEQKRILQVL